VTEEAPISKLLDIFFPHAASSRERMLRNNNRFVHYTSAANALSIIKTKRLWMRNATCMADFREVAHGLGVLHRYFSTRQHRQEFDAALNECSPGIAKQAFDLFTQWAYRPPKPGESWDWDTYQKSAEQSIQLQTYITSISEHDGREDLHGRLSMWRAFGNMTIPRVAMVFRIPVDVGSNGALNASLHPVAYFTEAEVAYELQSVRSNVRSNIDFLRSIDPQRIVAQLLAMLMTNVSCLKHEGFHEEKEWRIVYFPQQTPSPHIESSLEVIAGIPQQIYKIPLENKPNAGLRLELTDLLDRIIIGPTQFPWAMYEAFVLSLGAAGVKDPSSRVHVSQIPVRT
jgi:hypothetical protein